MTRRRVSPEAIFLARRIAHRNRLEGTGVSPEVIDQWLTAWEGRLTGAGWMRGRPRFGTSPRTGSPSSDCGDRNDAET
jgi:hypothetical protein